MVDVEGGSLVLRVPENSTDDFYNVSKAVSEALEGIDSLPVIPREVEDILSISTAERHRWLKGGRLHSAGTRTVKLRGRTRKITFHVFDPRHVEDVLDLDLAAVWREEDALAAAENRRRAAGKAALTRAKKNAQSAKVRPLRPVRIRRRQDFAPPSRSLTRTDGALSGPGLRGGPWLRAGATAGVECLLPPASDIVPFPGFCDQLRG